MAPHANALRALICSLIIFFLDPKVVYGSGELQVIFKNTESFTKLNENQQKCAVSSVYSVCYASKCEDKACFCTGPQFIADTTDKCLIQQGKYNTGMYSVDTYNGIMAFFGNECGTFQVQFKGVMTQSITYSTSYTVASAPTKANSQATTTGGAPDSGSNTSKTTETTAPSSGKSGLSVEVIIGIVAGIATVIATCIAAYMCCCR